MLATDPDPTNTASDWLESSRDDKDYQLSGFSELDYDASTETLRLFLPDLQPKGRLVSAVVHLWYAKNASVTTHPRFGLEHPDGDSLSTLAAAASSGYPSDTPLEYATVTATSITTWDKIKDGTLFAETREAGSVLRVHRICLVLTYVPSMTVVRQGSSREEATGRYTVSGRKDRNYNASHAVFSTYRTVRSPDILSYEAAGYTYQVGVPDDGSGTYTGTASAVIEHPADIAQ